MARVMVAMSGGVDSSVAAALLKKEGHEVVGVTMRIWNGEPLPEQERGHCCYGPDEEDIEDARKVAQALDIPFHVFDLRREYKNEVLDYVLREYLCGRTPNPCIRCNRRVKLDKLVEKAWQAGIGFDYVATGHYARVEWSQSKRRYLLKKASDETKDQSYFLSSLSQAQLGRCLFPLGNHTKKEVRGLASAFDLAMDDRPESQDFVAGGYSSLFRAAARPGPILDRQGNVLGEHRGIPFYTIGQRKGLGISAREALYVTSIDQERNAIVAGTREELYEDELICAQPNWIAIPGLRHPTKVKAKIRYSHRETEAVIAPLAKDEVHVKFKEPQMAITPGQAVVFYNRDVVLGGGTIERATRGHQEETRLKAGEAVDTMLQIGTG